MKFREYKTYSIYCEEAKVTHTKYSFTFYLHIHGNGRIDKILETNCTSSELIQKALDKLLITRNSWPSDITEYVIQNTIQPKDTNNSTNGKKLPISFITRITKYVNQVRRK